jgi:hypothetical protein
MKQLSANEIKSVSGAMSEDQGLAALGVVAGAAAVAAVAPVAAGAVLVGVIGIAAIDIAESLTS